MNRKNGSFLAQDSLNNSIILEWEEVSGHSDRLAEKIKSISSILAASYAQTEVVFARQKPELVSTDFMLKSLAPFLVHGAQNVDWNSFQKKTESLLKDFFSTFDWVKSSGAHDINFFVMAHEKKTGQSLGVIQFFITPEFELNTIKAALYGVIPSAQNRGLEKMLMSSIFRLRPHITRIFLHTRSTNQQAITDYQNWGFTQFAGVLPNWTDLEYLAERSDTLQKVSDCLVSQN